VNAKATRSLWMAATVLVAVAVLFVFVSGNGTTIDLRTPFWGVLVALLGLSVGVAAVIYTVAYVKIMRALSRGIPYRQTSWWWLVFWGLSLSEGIIAMPVGRGSITLDLPTGLVVVLAVFLASGGLWIQHGFVISGRSSYPAKDERTDRVQGKAALYTLFVSIGVIIGLLVYDVTLAGSIGLLELSGSAALILLLFAIVVSYAVLHWHFNRGGKV
jgi:hypothetical protein